MAGTSFTVKLATGSPKRVREQYPDQPWRWKPEWAAGRIRYSGLTMFLVAFFFALFWNAVSTPILFVLPRELAKGNKAVLIALLFPAVGIGLAAWAVLAFIRWRKFGNSAFELAAVPGVPGLPLRGVLHAPMVAPPPDGFKVALNCIRRVTTGSGKNRHTSESILWQEEKVIAADRHGDRDGLRVPVDFTLPPDQPSTTEPGGTDAATVLWRLDVKAELPGADYVANFEIPVFAGATPEPGPAAGQDFGRSSLLAMPAAAAPPPPDWPRAGIHFETRANGLRLWYFPAARLKGVVAFSLLFFLIWTGALVGMILAHAPIFFAIIWALFDLLIGYGLVTQLFRTTLLEAGRGAIAWRSGLLGRGKGYALRLDEIDSITPAQSMQMGSKLYYALKLTTRNGRKFTVAHDLTPLTLANRLAAELLKPE